MSASDAIASPRITVIGAGKMGGAIVGGWVASGAVPAASITVVNRRPETARALADRWGVGVAGTLTDAVAGAGVVVVGVKPWQVGEILREIAPALPPDCLIISVAAGVSLSAMGDALAPRRFPLVRVMPNTPAQIGAAASAYCATPAVSPDQTALVETLFGAIGVIHAVTEAQIDAVIGVAGSGVAYFYLIIEALIDGGVRAGLPRAVARDLVVQTALGAARMVGETGEHPAVLKDAVTTPGGTTIAALDVLERAGVRGTLIAAVLAAQGRARELG